MGLQGTWLLPLALISLAIGAMGVLAAHKLDRLVTFSVISSMGMVMVTISLFTPESTAAALYYIIHSTFAAAALFLITDLVRSSRGSLDLTPMPVIAGAVTTSALFFLAAIAMAGLPPLSGFLGKLLVLQAAFPTDAVVWVFAVVLISSLVNIVGFSRAGSILFWKAKSIAPAEDAPEADPPNIMAYLAVGGVITLLVAHTVLAGPLHRYMMTTAAQLYAPEPYISTVLDTPGKLSKPEGKDDGKKDEGH